MSSIVHPPLVMSSRLLGRLSVSLPQLVDLAGRRFVHHWTCATVYLRLLMFCALFNFEFLAHSVNLMLPCPQVFLLVSLLAFLDSVWLPSDRQSSCLLLSSFCCCLSFVFNLRKNVSKALVCFYHRSSSIGEYSFLLLFLTCLPHQQLLVVKIKTILCFSDSWPE